MTASEIIDKLQLEPLPNEGGYHRETWRSPHTLTIPCLPPGLTGEHCLETCIYYLITPDSFSQMHKLPSPEIWHFYLGDPAEQIQITPDGRVKRVVLGNNIAENQHLQIVVPANAWQGTRLAEGGKFALFGTTVSPSFEFRDYVAGELESLSRAFTVHADEIKKYFNA